MILVVGLSPAWQRTYVFESFEETKVNRAQEVHTCASGKVLNVAMALLQLRADFQILTLVGGQTGKAIQAEFQSRAICAHWLEVEAPTRVCTTIVDRKTGNTTELVEPMGPIKPEELAAFKAAFKPLAEHSDVVVITGSLPEGTPPEFVSELVEGGKAKLILDIRGPELLLAAAARPYIVKPNRDELAATFKTTIANADDLRLLARQLCAAGASHVLVTDGPNAVPVFSDNMTCWLEPKRVSVVNPIGSGDCLTAGLALGACQGWPILDAARLGMLLAAENAQTLLPARFSSDVRRRTQELDEIRFWHEKEV